MSQMLVFVYFDTQKLPVVCMMVSFGAELRRAQAPTGGQKQISSH